MRKTVNHIVLGVLTALYLLVTTGFALHICDKEESVDLFLLSSEKECKELHDNCGCSEDYCSTHTHDESCCSTQYFLLEVESLKADLSMLDFVLPIWNLPIIALSTGALHAEYLIEGGKLYSYRAPPHATLFSSKTLAKISQWRL